jgi:uncharacterized membrane protein YoaK (UPF0700 family)
LELTGRFEGIASMPQGVACHTKIKAGGVLVLREGKLLSMRSVPSANDERNRPMRAEEAIEIALLLAFSGGYFDAYTWVIHGVMANTQTANLVLLWVHGTAGDWGRAVHFIPPMIAFVLGVVIAALVRRAFPERATEITTLINIALLVIVQLIHIRVSNLANVLGIAFVAAMQASMFTVVEGTVYTSIMITGNLRLAIEGALGAFFGRRDMLCRSCIFAAICVVFGIGAAAGAFLAKGVPYLALGAPIMAMLIVLFLLRR